MGWAIICDARKGEGLGIDTLALVDRSLSRRLWWTSDRPEITICYEKRSAADFAARRLKKNNARVVPHHHAMAILRGQARTIKEVENERDHQAALAACEGGWDDHKGY